MHFIYYSLYRGMKPQVFLKHGDIMKLGVEGLGEQTQKTISA